MKEKIVRKTLADGTVKEYRYSREPKAPTEIRLCDVVERYRNSPEWAKLATGSRQRYEDAFDRVSEHLWTAPIREIQRRHVLMQRNLLSDTPGLANIALAALGSAFRFALNYDLVDASPVTRVPKLELGEWRAWTDAEVDKALAGLPEHFRRAVVLGIYTGQRIGDLLRMEWTHYDGEAIQVRQEKTGAALWIPCHSALKAELASWAPAEPAGHILRSVTGKPFTMKNFGTHFPAHLRAAGVEGAVFHGLRKVAAARLAEAGASEREIMAVTGHRSAAMISLYAKSADQRLRAQSAIDKLETARKPARKLTANLLK